MKTKNVIIVLAILPVAAAVVWGILQLVISGNPKMPTQVAPKEIYIDPMQRNRDITVNIGDKIYTYASEKPSTGEKVQEPVYDKTILRLYNTKDEDKGNGKLGGDNIYHYYYFEAIKAGNTVVESKRTLPSSSVPMSATLFTVRVNTATPQ